MPSVIAHYQEIALKGKNRNWFLRRLVRNLRELLGGLSVRDIRTPMGRIEIVFDREDDWPHLQERLTRAFGLANFSLARRAPLDLEAIGDAIVRDLPDEAVPSFRIAVRRADKRFAIPSPEIERLIGRRVQDARGWKVDLTRPALVIWIELVPGEAFYHFGKLPGPGGLPVGSSGRVVILLSGGIDSPVAAWRMMRRGCRASFVHFHSYPFLSKTSQEKARELTERLTRFQLRSRLYLVPFGELQRQVTLSVPGPLRVVVYRRMMLRIAEQIASQLRAPALVTGEVVGQVASQTLDNMSLISSASRLPVLRPLIGMDKEEITAEAERLGTYPISIVPDEDCCTLFTPRHPATRAHPRVVEVAESTLPVAEMVHDALDRMVLERFTYPHGVGLTSAAVAAEERW
ncbi:MAG TPA: tRNA uracil 4-sulfurtransferase ThiI [Vicinamibacterales bacterium]|nr:tRNA uracil 4-sulfurtransferase ThiI [Vicinamibacterales bacterium]